MRILNNIIVFTLIFPLLVFGKVLKVDTLTAPTTNGDLTLNADGTGEVVTSFPLVIGGTSNDASALLQIDSTTQGVLLPRMTTAQRTAIGTPADGLAVYDTDLDAVFIRANGAWVQYGQQGTEVKSALVTDGASVGTVSLDNDNLINGNCTNTANTGDYTCTFQNAYASAPHCWVQNTGNGEKSADVTTTTTTVSIQWRQTCGPYTTFTPSSTWTANVTHYGAYQQCGSKVSFDIHADISGAVNAANLVYTLPNSWEIDSNYPDAGAVTAHLGRGSYHDTGTSINGNSFHVRYNSTTQFGVYIDSTNGVVNHATPVTWANGDDVFTTFELPISGLDEDGPGVDNNFLIFCKAQ